MATSKYCFYSCEEIFYNCERSSFIAVKKIFVIIFFITCLCVYLQKKIFLLANEKNFLQCPRNVYVFIEKFFYSCEKKIFQKNVPVRFLEHVPEQSISHYYCSWLIYLGYSTNYDSGGILFDLRRSCGLPQERFHNSHNNRKWLKNP